MVLADYPEDTRIVGEDEVKTDPGTDECFFYAFDSPDFPQEIALGRMVCREGSTRPGLQRPIRQAPAFPTGGAGKACTCWLSARRRPG